MKSELPPPVIRLLGQKGCLTIRDLADVLDLAYWTAHQLCQSGRIKATNVGSGNRKARWRIYEPALREFFAKNTVKAVPDSTPDAPNYFLEDGTYIGPKI